MTSRKSRPLSAPHFPGQWNEQEDGLAAQGILPQDHHLAPKPVELTGTSGETERPAWLLADFLEVSVCLSPLAKSQETAFQSPTGRRWLVGLEIDSQQESFKLPGLPKLNRKGCTEMGIPAPSQKSWGLKCTHLLYPPVL